MTAGILRLVLAGLLLSAACVGAGPAAAGGGATGGAGVGPGPVDVDGDCHDDVPTDPALQPGATPPLSVLLVVDDGIPSARAAEIARAVAALYRPAGVELRVRPRRVSVDGDDARDLIAQVKRAVGGSVPVGFDAVHLITPVDVKSQGEATSIGLAECIGGIRDRRRAFSVSEISPEVRSLTLGPVTGSGDEEARSAAHEIGHLLGARHEHSNCAEGAPAPRPTDSPCTLMFFAAPSSDVFGVLESAVIRGYVQRYAG